MRLLLILIATVWISACNTHSTNSEDNQTSQNDGSLSGPVLGPEDNPSDIGADSERAVEKQELERQVKTLIKAASGGAGVAAFVLPESDALESIPQDPRNPLTAEKVALGRLLFHDTAFALNGRYDENGTWSCATCHHAAAGFKAGARQGIGNGGADFGKTGAERHMAFGFDDKADEDSQQRPDFQPIASPTVLHSAWQDVMLWNGQFGNSENGIINVAVNPDRLATADTPKAINNLGLSGVETQAIAGTGVHRLKFAEDTPLVINDTYRQLWNDAYGDESIDVLEGAGKAIAAFERTVIANQAPFQQWLRGESDSLTTRQLRGARLFFGVAGCSDCHQGPGLSSAEGARTDQMFMAIGFGDIDYMNDDVMGDVDDDTRLGRGGFTGLARENYQFKIPQLYNLKDTNFLGHGGTFSSVREVIEYKNNAIAQNTAAENFLDYRFQPLNLTINEMDDLEDFIVNGLYDPELERYQPNSVPSGHCIVVDAGVKGANGVCNQ